MPEATFAKAETVPPETQLLEMIFAQFVSRLIHLTATLKLPDYLAEGPKTAEELADGNQETENWSHLGHHLLKTGATKCAEHFLRAVDHKDSADDDANDQ